MSHEEKKCYYASGVFKVDFKSAGYKDLKELAVTWSQDPHFMFLEVRKVSPENWGIQFAYYVADAGSVETEKTGGPIKLHYKKELTDLYGAGFYAWDYHECDEPATNVIVAKGFQA